MNTTSLVQDVDTLLSNDGVPAETTATIAEARALWGDIRSGTAPDADRIARLGAMLSLDFHRLLALLLKQKCEGVLAQALGEAEGHTHPDPNIRDTRFLKTGVIPSSEALFQILMKHGYVPNAFAYDSSSLADTIQEMILMDLHVRSNTGPELHAFAERHRRSLELLQRGPHDIQTLFRRTKREWLARQDELAERLLYLESRRLDHENLSQRWMAQFGEAYVALRERTSRVESLQRRIDLKLAGPGLTRDAVDQLVAETDAATRRELQHLRYRLSLASFPMVTSGGMSVSPEQVVEYRRQCKQALREIWLLIHPDRLAQQAHYGRLTDDQKHMLSELWHQAMSVRAEELGFAPGFLGHECRSLTVLLDIVETVTHILNNMGIDTDVSLIITGDTIEEQLEWLTRSIQRLDQELDNVQAELMLLLADREIQERAALLSATPAQQDTVRREMHERARAYEERADRMDAYLARLFELKDAPADVVGQTVPLMMTGEEPS